ncbi:hypothetical protein L0636_01120 [Halomonas janggokensis]|uniref:DUF5753 domain-containing protein n=1 Tax=Vreelandella janggokensis TaxID=370767 RepID=A0ABT4IS48_9GAMM|nr:hypothetical protein [Halomonas janggokensis]MCZ0926489.1 hypothetical protein [Halomonas janggokensis]MCZ0929027.1 hypothetical protein [Halomonas janggokensis]
MMKARIAGIPCQVNVTSYTPATPGGWDEPPSGPEIEYTVYDLRSRKAGWLMAKITDEDDQVILEQYEARLQVSRDDARIDAYIASLEDRAWA